jgi:hypothetical protein
MSKDITYCDYLCANEKCERHLTRLKLEEEFVKKTKEDKSLKYKGEEVSVAKFEECEWYNSTVGCFVPM